MVNSHPNRNINITIGSAATSTPDHIASIVRQAGGPRNQDHNANATHTSGWRVIVASTLVPSGPELIVPRTQGLKESRPRTTRMIENRSCTTLPWNSVDGRERPNQRGRL